MQAALAFTFERFDGGGLPSGESGDAIPIEMRVASSPTCSRFISGRTGPRVRLPWPQPQRRRIDPQLVDLYTADADQILTGPPAGDVWSAALREAPDRANGLDEDALDSLLVALGDFVDLKCPFTLGHSRAVAALAADAATVGGLEADNVAIVRRAGHVHDLGRIGVSNQIWSKPGPLSLRSSNECGCIRT